MRGYLESVRPKLIKKPLGSGIDMSYHKSFKDEQKTTNNQISKSSSFFIFIYILNLRNRQFSL